MIIDVTKYATQEQLFKFLKDNKSALKAQKKLAIKHADAVAFSPDKCGLALVGKGTDKAVSTAEIMERDVLNVRLVINTTGILDSHGDVHIKGLWKRSLKQDKTRYLLQEHRNSFDGVISDNVKAYTRNYTLEQLGYIDSYSRTVEALVFDAEIHKDRNHFMFEQYGKGYVKQHSVGMRYINLELAVNSDDSYFSEEKEVWDKYIDQVINRDDAEKQGYFWAVTEAAEHEGSAVLFGSNPVTPTISVKNIPDPSEDTPDKSENPTGRSLFEAIQGITILN